MLRIKLVPGNGGQETFLLAIVPLNRGKKPINLEPDDER
jgi:hypothetical protein